MNYHSDLDLALLQIEKPRGNLSVVTVGNPEEVSIGDPVIADQMKEMEDLMEEMRGKIRRRMGK